jgi:hypothetical protein
MKRRQNERAIFSSTENRAAALADTPRMGQGFVWQDLR